jgi:FixJ family two-component response regulator
MSAARVFIVNDDPVMVLVLGGILRAAGRQVEAFQQSEALLARLAPDDRGCVVVDLRMPGLGGLELQQALLARAVLLPLIFVSGRADVAAAVAAMKGGAVDFLAKPVVPAELCAAVARALASDEAQTTRRAVQERAQARWAELSPREREVCRLFARGLADKQIAAALGTASSTVQAQRTRALHKLQVGSAVELVRLLAAAGDDV